jgi:hypothetical protein
MRRRYDHCAICGGRAISEWLNWRAMSAAVFLRFFAVRAVCGCAALSFWTLAAMPPLLP